MQVYAKLVFARQAQAADPQAGLAHGSRVVHQLGRLAANHEARQGRIGLVRRVAHAGDLAPAQHGAGIAQRANLVQLVADVQNAAALRRELLEHHKQFFYRLGREHRGRLVQDEQLRVGEQRADDFHPLHFAHTQGVHRTFGVNVQAVLGGFLADAAGHLTQAQAFVQTEPHVFGHRDGVKQIEMLEHHADAKRARLFGVAHMGHLAVKGNLAGVGLDGAVDDLHQRGLARAVFAQHGVGLAWQHRQRHIAVGDDAGIGFGNTGELKAGCDHAAFGGMARMRVTGGKWNAYANGLHGTVKT